MKQARKPQNRFIKMITAMMMKILPIHIMIQRKTMMMNQMSLESEAVATVDSIVQKRWWMMKSKRMALMMVGSVLLINKISQRR
jgi:hypothetical protein